MTKARVNPSRVDYKIRCNSCAYLADKDGWFCEFADDECRNVKQCPSDLPGELFWDDLSEQGQEKIKNFYGDEHNFDVFPVAVLL